MPVFEVFNDDGYFQIDSLYPNLRLVQHQIVTCDQPQSGPAAPNIYYTKDIAVSGQQNPVIAFRCGTRCASVGVGWDGTNYNHRFSTYGQANVEYWAFATTPEHVPVGMEVYAPDGTFIWSSKDKPAKLAGNWTAPPLDLGASASGDAPGVNTLAVVMNSASMGMTGTASGSIMWPACVAMSGANHFDVIVDTAFRSVVPYTGGIMRPGVITLTLLDVYGQ